MTLRKGCFHSPKASYEAFQLLYLLKAQLFSYKIFAVHSFLLLPSRSPCQQSTMTNEEKKQRLYSRLTSYSKSTIFSSLSPIELSSAVLKDIYQKYPLWTVFALSTS